MATDLPRAERVAEAAELRTLGLTQQQIADRMGLSPSYVQALLTDPTGEKEIARRKRYGRLCENCGKLTDGSGGRAKAPRLCLACRTKARAPEHGTYSRYTAGCRCEFCRAANAAHQRTLKGRTPPTHGYSGYRNYGCRCEICTAANRDYQWLHSEYQQRWRRKVWKTTPPSHGVRGYQTYGCRCDICRAAAAENRRRLRLEKRSQTA